MAASNMKIIKAMPSCAMTFFGNPLAIYPGKHITVFQMTHGHKNQPDSGDSSGFFNSGFLGKSGLETDDFRWPRLN